MIRYIELGEDKQLHEIVMAGSHDAGITGGGKNVQTQSLSIGGQAEAGVRFFDLRVAAGTVGVVHKTFQGNVKEASLMAFHADKRLMKNREKVRYLPEVGRIQGLTRTKLRGGAFGEGLQKMLREARAFVEKHTSEFLILKFDKCENWSLIAEVITHELYPVLYKGSGNLNTKRLRDLKGKVICLFSSKGLAATPPEYHGANGILGFRNLYESGGGYDPNYRGLQYFGKGGTSPFNAIRKFHQNESKQRKLMRKGMATAPEVLGMMYWTTTGLKESIQKRNEGMWSDKNLGKLMQMWRDGLEESINMRIAEHIDPKKYSSAPILKAFMPNIVMVDFANEFRCQVIYDLNFVAAVELTLAAQAVDSVRQAYTTLPVGA